jgi:hypothetical protein
VANFYKDFWPRPAAVSSDPNGKVAKNEGLTTVRGEDASDGRCGGQGWRTGIHLRSVPFVAPARWAAHFLVCGLWRLAFRGVKTLDWRHAAISAVGSAVALELHNMLPSTGMRDQARL